MPIDWPRGPEAACGRGAGVAAGCVYARARDDDGVEPTRGASVAGATGVATTDSKDAGAEADLS